MYHDVMQRVGASDHDGVLHVGAVLGPDEGQCIGELACRHRHPAGIAEQRTIGLRRGADEPLRAHHREMTQCDSDAGTQPMLISAEVSMGAKHVTHTAQGMSHPQRVCCVCFPCVLHVWGRAPGGINAQIKVGQNDRTNSRRRGRAAAAERMVD